MDHREWLRQNHQPVFQRAAINETSPFWSNLWNAFTFKYTPEGYRFWSMVYGIIEIKHIPVTRKQALLDDLCTSNAMFGPTMEPGPILKNVRELMVRQMGNRTVTEEEFQNTELPWQKERRETIQKQGKVIALRNDIRKLLGL